MVVLVLCACRFGFQSNPVAGDAAESDEDAGDAEISIDAAVPSCGGISRVVDDFEDGLISDRKWAGRYANPGTSLTETGGHAVLTPAASNPGQFVGLISSRWFDMRGRRFVVEVSEYAANGASSGIQIESQGNNYFSLNHITQFQAALSNPTYMFLGNVPDTGQRFMAISETGGNVFYELSSDGMTFTPFAMVASPFDLTYARAHVFSGSNNSIASPGQMRIANVGGIYPVEPACKASTFVDPFDAYPDLRWRQIVVDPGFTLVHANDHIEMSTDGTVGFTSMRTAPELDLRDSEFVVELNQYPTQADTVAYFMVRLDGQNLIELIVTAANVVARVTVNGNPTNLPGSASNPAERYLRIAESSGTLLMQLSTDRMTWRTQHSTPTPFPVDSINVDLRLRTEMPTGADMIRWNNFNTP
jgi:hypothetical protein